MPIPGDDGRLYPQPLDDSCLNLEDLIRDNRNVREQCRKEDCILLDGTKNWQSILEKIVL